MPSGQPGNRFQKLVLSPVAKQKTPQKVHYKKKQDVLLFSHLSFVNCPVHFIYICKEGSGKEEGAADGTVTWSACVMIDGHLCWVSSHKTSFGLRIMCCILEPRVKIG